MKLNESLIAVLLLAVATVNAHAEPHESKSGELYDALAQMDHHVFETAFVECNAEKFRALFTQDAEFYHDVTGPTFGEDVWTLKGCPRNDDVRRMLEPGSLEVFPMKNYGAIQTGEHWFVEEGAANSTLAKFIHLWRFENDEWRISRVLSFDHRTMPKSARTSPAESVDDTAVDADLLQTVQRLDTVVFEDGYNNCDIDKLATVIAEDLEFYHDQGGASYGRQPFLDSMQKGICELDYKARRELVEGSMQVFPLYSEGELYGVIQDGEHRFHATYPGKAEYPTGIAKFTLLWLLKDGKWQLSRALSFDHAPLD